MSPVLVDDATQPGRHRRNSMSIIKENSKTRKKEYTGETCEALSMLSCTALGRSMRNARPSSRTHFSDLFIQAFHLLQHRLHSIGQHGAAKQHERDVEVALRTPATAKRRGKQFGTRIRKRCQGHGGKSSARNEDRRIVNSKPVWNTTPFSTSRAADRCRIICRDVCRRHAHPLGSAPHICPFCSCAVASLFPILPCAVR